MPGIADDEANTMTDIFGLGSTIYTIMQGHEPFPELDTFDDEATIATRFAARQFPALDHFQAGPVIRKCWESSYLSAEEIVQHLSALSTYDQALV